MKTISFVHSASDVASRYTGVWNKKPNMETTVTQNLLFYYLGTWSTTDTKMNCTVSTVSVGGRGFREEGEWCGVVSVLHACMSVCVRVSVMQASLCCTNGHALPAPQVSPFRAYFRGPGYNSSQPSSSGVCVLSNTSRNDALSPTFSVSADGTWDYIKERTGNYSSWAESR